MRRCIHRRLWLWLMSKNWYRYRPRPPPSPVWRDSLALWKSCSNASTIENSGVRSYLRVLLIIVLIPPNRGLSLFSLFPPFHLLLLHLIISMLPSISISISVTLPLHLFRLPLLLSILTSSPLTNQISLLLTTLT